MDQICLYLVYLNKLSLLKYKYNSPSEDDCILDAVLIVSPKRQYLGILVPTTPKNVIL